MVAVLQQWLQGNRSSSIAVQNTPSDGVQRRIPNAIGAFSLAPPSPLAGLYIEVDDSNVFVNTTRHFSVKATMNISTPSLLILMK